MNPGIKHDSEGKISEQKELMFYEKLSISLHRNPPESKEKAESLERM